MEGKKKRNKLAVFAVIMLIIAAILITVLIDMVFIPSGNKWETMKADFYSQNEEYSHLSEKEVWETIKTEFSENGVIPVKSGFICWFTLSKMWDEKIAEEEAYEAAVADADLFAAELKTAVNELAETTELEDMYAQVTFLGEHIYISGMGNALDETHPLYDCVKSLEAGTRRASALAVIHNGKCTAVAYLPDTVDDVAWGVDCPHIANDGTFDLSMPWGNGWSDNNFITGIA